ncbi:MAG: DUF5662 family protein [Angelakisella sp.]
MRHKGRNRHHFEYWTDVSPVTHQYEPLEMPTEFFVEMCWIARCQPDLPGGSIPRWRSAGISAAGGG